MTKPSIPKICESCGVNYLVRKERAEKARYCSKNCMTKHCRGKNNPAFKRQEKTCQQCGIKYMFLNSGRVQKGQGGASKGKLFCTRKCYLKSPLAKKHQEEGVKLARQSLKVLPWKGRYWKRKGNTKEFKTMDILEAEGYYCMRSSGSHGIWDIIAVGPVGVKLVQVKSNTRPGGEEMER